MIIARRKILFVQSRVLPHGGLTAVFAWMLQALSPEYEITVLTWAPFDIPALNAHYGTTLKAQALHCLAPPFGLRLVAHALSALDPDPGSIQHTLLLARHARRIAASFDLVIGCEMESDFGTPGMQYIHYPWLARFAPQSDSTENPTNSPGLLGLLRGHIRPWQWLGDFSFRRMRSNLTLTNSDWTARLVRQAYVCESVTLYPPASGDFGDIPWSERANGFVAIGRIHPEKRIDWIIHALEPLRAEIPDLHLHLVGTAGSQRDERNYFARLQPMLATHTSWVTLHLNLSRTQLAALLGRQRYGVHAMIDEHFGIAIAEMVLARCIPFLHNSGGATEIVNHDPRLLYSTTDELRARILAVVGSPAIQSDVRSALAAGADRFTPESFMRQFRAIIASRIDEAGNDNLSHGS